MSREIKFRAWWKDEKEMHYLKHLDLEFCHRDEQVMLMQYTGLKDKNDIEIYEGDIVRVLGGVEYMGQYEFNKTLEVRYSGNCFDLFDIYKNSCYGWGFSDYITEIKVIGNIYENSELLKEA